MSALNPRSHGVRIRWPLGRRHLNDERWLDQCPHVGLGYTSPMGTGTISFLVGWEIELATRDFS